MDDHYFRLVLLRDSFVVTRVGDPAELASEPKAIRLGLVDMPAARRELEPVDRV